MPSRRVSVFGVKQGPLDRYTLLNGEDAWFCIQALCFGDFHLGQQMKVTRPPGRDPACRHEPKTQKLKPPQSPATSTATHDPHAPPPHSNASPAHKPHP